jgi:hypothetical protein
MVEPENLVLTLLQELPAQMDARFAAMDTRFDKIEKRLEMMHANGDKARRQFIGHWSMVERSIASFEVDMREAKRRVELLETTES